MAKSPKKSLWSMPTFLRPALSDIEWSAHYEGEKLRARERHRNLTALKRYFSMQRGLRADIPAVLPSQFTPLFGIEAADTEHQSVLPVWRRKTQPLAIWDQDTQPEIRVIEPRLTLKMRRGA